MHAVIQYRLVTDKTNPAHVRAMVKPYIIDLGSANGTKLNGQPIDPERYWELKENDVLMFGERCSPLFSFYNS